MREYSAMAPEGLGRCWLDRGGASGKRGVRAQAIRGCVFERVLGGGCRTMAHEVL